MAKFRKGDIIYCYESIYGSIRRKVLEIDTSKNMYELSEFNQFDALLGYRLLYPKDFVEGYYQIDTVATMKAMRKRSEND